MHIRVETGFGHPGQVSSRSSGSDLVYKISEFYIGLCAIIMEFAPDQNNEPSLLHGEDGRVSHDCDSITISIIYYTDLEYQ